MKVTVCEMRDSAEEFAQDWERLVEHVRAERSQLVLLPEMPFFPWFGLTAVFDEACWKSVIEAHEAWLKRLPELAPAGVISTRPVNAPGKRLNEGYVWDAAGGYRPAHAKYYLPDEPGFWEASWYQRGSGDFTSIQCGPALIGFQICSELWFMHRGRAYGQAGAHIIACPRATPLSTADKWLAGGRANAVISGAFCLSSNHAGLASNGMAMGGQGWVIDPDGEVLAVTTPDRPFVSLDIDLALAEQARQTYPRYVLD